MNKLYEKLGGKYGYTVFYSTSTHALEREINERAEKGYYLHSIVPKDNGIVAIMYKMR